MRDCVQFGIQIVISEAILSENSIALILITATVTGKVSGIVKPAVVNRHTSTQFTNSKLHDQARFQSEKVGVVTKPA